MPPRWSTASLTALTGPADPLRFMPQAPPMDGCTVRQRVRLRRGGSRLRIEISNEFGTEPLVLAGVRVEDEDGPGVPVLLDGAERWVVGPGVTGLADSVAVTTTAGDELTVTLAVSSGVPTFLHSAGRTAHIAPGDLRGTPMPRDAARSPSAFWVSRVLTDRPAEGPVVVAFGDSVTRGDGTTLDADQRYPDHLQAILEDTATVLNAGIGGNRLLRARVGPSMLGRFARDVAAVREATHVVVMGGLNDLGLPGMLDEPRPAVDALLAGLATLRDRSHDRGLTPILSTLTPCGAGSVATFTDPDVQRTRQEINTALLAWSRDADVVVADVAAALADPSDPTRLAAAYDSGDGVHPSDAGAARCAAEVARALRAPRRDLRSAASTS